MIKLYNVEVSGFEAAIRGMRNPHNSWNKSDSDFKTNTLGENDYQRALKLAKAGTDHRKFMRMINVTIDVIAPLYWWKEFDTYKVGTVSNSCSTMHTIHKKEFVRNDFSHEHLDASSLNVLDYTIVELNINRGSYLETNDKKWWWQMIQLLPSSYNQRRTIQVNYEVLTNMYKSRKNHKLDEWQNFCKWIETLPYSELITVNSIERNI